jgi:hypothetical protein
MKKLNVKWSLKTISNGAELEKPESREIFNNKKLWKKYIYFLKF